MKNRLLFIAIIFIAIVSVYFLDITNSRYVSEIQADGNIDFANSVIDLDTLDISQDELLIYPGSTEEAEFTIKNYDGTKVNEIEMDYYIDANIVASQFPMDTDYKIYDITNGQEKQLTKVEGKGYGPVKLNYLEQEDRRFKIVFSWTINSTNTNNLIGYADMEDHFTIKVKTEGLYEKELTSEELNIRSYPCNLLTATVSEIDDGQDNTFNVFIENTNPYDIRCTIGGDENFNVIYNGSTDETEIIVKALQTTTVRVTFGTLTNQLYDEAILDKATNRIYTYFTMTVNGSKPYNGNERRLGDRLKIWLEDTIKVKLVAYADNITRYEEGHTFTGPSAQGDGDLCSIVDPVSKNIIYFYRGDISNNYVSFAGQLWRILRINDDGSLRLILDSISESSSYADLNIPSNHTIDDAIELLRWENSHVYEKLHTWYDKYIEPNGGEYVVPNHYVFDTTYDDTTSSQAGDCYYFGTYMRVGVDEDTFQPTFSYTDESLVEDKIGLITGDEVIYAGGYWKTDNTHYFLYNSSISTDSWTMSPSFWDHSAHYKAGMMALSSSGRLHDWPSNGNTLTGSIGIRPVISIRGDLNMDGNGTKTNPYAYISWQTSSLEGDLE